MSVLCVMNRGRCEFRKAVYSVSSILVGGDFVCFVSDRSVGFRLDGQVFRAASGKYDGQPVSVS